MLVEKFEDELSDDLVRYHQESHVKRELHFIANITPVKRSTEINTQKNSSHKEKKDIPEDVVYFAEMVADNCPEVSQKLVKKYIMRVYDHSKPLSIDHLIGVMGMQQNCREKVESMAKDLGMSLYAKDATTLTSEDEDMSYIKASLGNTYEYQIAKSMQPIPHTSEEIKELFVKAGFMISNEKQLTKQIQEVLIASDADGKMRRKLLFGLQHPAMSWYQKKNKFKTLNIALGYRVVVKTIDKKEYVIGVFHHDDYDLLMPEFNFK